MADLHKRQLKKVVEVLNDNQINVISLGQGGSPFFGEYVIEKDVSGDQELGTFIIDKDGDLVDRELSFETYLGCIDFSSQINSGNIELNVMLDNIGENATITIYSKER